MKLFLDTGVLEEVRRGADWGILDGVTTNPTLIAKAGGGFRDTVEAICDLLPHGEISAEVVAQDFEGMLAEALEIQSWRPNLVIKVPLTEAGVRTVRELSDRGIKTNVTLVFSVAQALLAAKAGATFISNFVGRVDDIGGDGMEAVAETVEMVSRYGFDSQVLAASIRHPHHILAAIRAGADISTAPLAVLQALYHHPLTESGLARFQHDWDAAGLKIG